MAEEFEPTSPRLKPPAIARALVAMAATPADRAVLIGDLEEEFSKLQNQSRAKAQAWYWRQTATSTPHLIAKRLASPPAKSFLITVAAAIGAYILVRFWDMIIARNAARVFFALFESQSYSAARAIYLLVQAAGFMVAGGGVAFFAFAREESFVRNLASRLAPAAALVFAPALIAQLAASDSYAPSFRLLQTGIALCAFAAGAWVAARIFAHRR